MKNFVFLVVICFLLSGCGKLGDDGRYEVKNIKLPYTTDTDIVYQDVIVKVDTQTGKVWRLQHGMQRHYTDKSNYSDRAFSFWEELGNMPFPGDKKLQK